MSGGMPGSDTDSAEAPRPRGTSRTAEEHFLTDRGGPHPARGLCIWR